MLGLDTLKDVWKRDFESKREEKERRKIHPSPSTKSRIKSLFNTMFDYALEYEIVPMNYARTFEISGDIIVEIEKNKKNTFHLPMMK